MVQLKMGVETFPNQGLFQSGLSFVVDLGDFNL